MDNTYMATIVIFAGTFEPENWMFCDGRILSIAQNTALFSLLGINYGGDAQTTFGLPDLKHENPDLHYIICTAGLYPRRS